MSQSEHKPAGFEGAERLAREFAEDRQKTDHLLDEAMSKAERHRSALESIWQDLQALFRLVRAWAKGEYPHLPWQTLTFAVAAVVYFVNPFDLVPDFLPGAGYLDDATVVGFVLKSIKRDIEQFLSWEQANAGATSSGTEAPAAEDE